MRSLFAAILLIAGAASADTPIKGLSLQSDANAGGHLITNLGSGFAAANGLAAQSAVSSLASMLTSTNIAIGYGAAAGGAYPVAYIATNHAAGGFYYQGTNYNGYATYTNATGWKLWKLNGFFIYCTTNLGYTAQGWEGFSSEFPFEDYDHISSATTGTLHVVPVGIVSAAQIGAGTNRTAGVMSFLGRPVARWDGAVWIGTGWVDRISIPALSGSATVTVTNAPIVNGVVVYNGSAAAWMVPSNIVATATDVSFAVISGSPMDNASLASELTAVSNVAASTRSVVTNFSAELVSVSNLAATALSAAQISSNVSAGTWRNPDWFALAWSDNPTSAPDSIQIRTNLDQVVQRLGFNQTRHDRVAQITEQHVFSDLQFSVVPSNLATISSNGYLSHISDGTVTAAVTSASFGRTNVLLLRTEGGAAERYWTGAPGSLRAAAIGAVALAVTNATMETFSAYDTNSMAFTRSTNLWLKPAPVCLAAWNSRAGWLGGGVLITPRHAITAHHAGFRPQVGDSVVWVDATNGAWTANVIAEKNVAVDISMIRLDADIPVARAKFIPSPAAYLPTGIREIPLACGEVHDGSHKMQLVLGGSASWGERGYWGIGWWKSPERPEWRSLFHHYPIPGDSSQPVLMTTGEDLVLLFCLYFPTQGPNVHSFIPEITGAIAAWGDTNTLEYLSVTNYTEF